MTIRVIRYMYRFIISVPCYETSTPPSITVAVSRAGCKKSFFTQTGTTNYCYHHYYYIMWTLSLLYHSGYVPSRAARRASSLKRACAVMLRKRTLTRTMEGPTHAHIHTVARASRKWGTLRPIQRFIPVRMRMIYGLCVNDGRNTG